MGRSKNSEMPAPHTRIALRAAVKQSTRKRCEIADVIGVTDRTLQRWLIGEIAPTAEQWAATMSLCGVSPAACFLAAELGRADLIGTESYVYIDELIHQLFTRIANVEEAGEMPLDPRGAARDASIISQSWSASYQRRKRFMDEQYIQSMLPPFSSIP